MSKLTIKPGARFRRDLKRAIRRGLDEERIKSVIKLLADGHELPEIYRDHPLKGNYIGYRECHIQSDWLLIYK